MSQVDKLLEQIHAEIDVRALSPVQYGVVDNESLVEYALAYLLANLNNAFGNAEPTKVWVGIVHHDNGVNVYAAKTEKELREQIYKYVCDCWVDIVDEDGDRDEDIEPNDSWDIPENHDEAIKYYFTNHPEGEWCDTVEIVI